MKKLAGNILLTIGVLTSISTATLIHVPQDQLTIQAGIDAAIDGDTVLVDTGRYVENINFNGKNIVLGSLLLITGDTSYIRQTLIDGNQKGSVVTFESAEDSTAFMTGFTITNGYIWGHGGGIFIHGSNPIFVNSILWNDSPQEIAFINQDDPKSVTLAYTDIDNGKTGIVESANSTVNWLEGNIDDDPRLIDPEGGNLNLQEGSPCIDAGTAFLVLESDTLVNLPATAYEGNAPDMGAFESPYSVGIAAERPLPAQFTLHPNYPNPFNPSTTIKFSMPQAGAVTLTVYDLLGREVTTLVDSWQEAGRHKVQWNATDIPSGIYFVKMLRRSLSETSGSFSQMRKITVLR